MREVFVALSGLAAATKDSAPLTVRAGGLCGLRGRIFIPADSVVPVNQDLSQKSGCLCTPGGFSGSLTCIGAGEGPHVR